MKPKESLLRFVREFRDENVSLRRRILHYALPFLLALAATLFVEIMSQRSLLGALKFLVLRPHLFLLNLLLISLLYIPMHAVRRKAFWASVVSVVIAALGITNFVIQSMRVTPLEWPDFYVFFATGSDIIHQYLPGGMIALIIVAIALAIAALVVLFIKLKKHKRYPFSALVSIVPAALLVLVLSLGYKAGSVIPKRFVNLVDAYHEYGFTYCFLGSIFDRGIDKPDEYSEELIDGYADKAQLGSPVKTPERKPNIVFVQLESFFDVNRVRDLAYSGYGGAKTNPLPNFTALLESCPSGYLHVPSIGAGTANTEFEVIAGMDLAAFGAGEYPYKTILKDTACESTAYLLSEIGYATHAIHNNRATFYDRNICYTNLGFETFTSLEYMLGVDEDDYNPQKWAKDAVLTNEILYALRASGGADYVYTVSVQGHGSYPENPVNAEQPFEVIGNLFEDELCAWKYYVNQLHEMDVFIGELLVALTAYKEETGEDTVLVLYGDHLPGGLVGISDENIKGPSIYATEYVIWSTVGSLGLADEDLEAFQLSAVVMDAVGIERGTFTRLHQNYRHASDYIEVLEAFQYDALYGERYLYGGEYPFETTDLVLGVNPITISEVTVDEEGTTVRGENFTKFSRITIGDEPVKTTLLPDGSLHTAFKAASGDEVAVAQYTSLNSFLSSTEEIIVD